MKKASIFSVLVGAFLMFLQFSATAQMFTEVKDLDNTCSLVKLKFTVSFPFGSGASCPPLNGYTLTSSGNSFTVNVSYNTCGAWAQFGCSRSDTIQFPLPMNAQQLTARMFTDNCGTVTATNSYSNVDVCNISAIGETMIESNSVHLIPNPAADLVKIKSSAHLLGFCIFDLNGRLLMDGDVKEEYLDVSRLESGMYFIRISTLKGTITKKLVIAR